MALLINLLRRKLLLTFLDQKELQRNTTLQESFKQLIQNLEHRIFIHVTKQCLNQYGQILKLTLINAINVADSLKGFFHSLSSLFCAHALWRSEADHVLKGFGQPVNVMEVFLF